MEKRERKTARIKLGCTLRARIASLTRAQERIMRAEGPKDALVYVAFAFQMRFMGKTI